MESIYREISRRKYKEHAYARENKLADEEKSSNEDFSDSDDSAYQPSSSASSDSCIQLITEELPKNKDECMNCRVECEQEKVQRKEHEKESEQSVAIEIEQIDSGFKNDTNVEYRHRIIDTDLPFIIINGKQYNSKLLWSSNEKYFYVKNSSSKIGVGYTCYAPKCTARVHVKGSKCVVANSVTHEHPNDQQLFINLTALNEMRSNLIMVNNCKSPLQVFNDVIAK